MSKDSEVPPAFDRRHTPRRAIRHVGVILTEPTATRQYCMVTDESEGGIRIIYTAANLKPPAEFTLWYADTEGRYRVVWHKGLFIGAELIARAAQTGANETLAEAAR